MQTLKVLCIRLKTKDRAKYKILRQFFHEYLRKKFSLEWFKNVESIIKTYFPNGLNILIFYLFKVFIFIKDG